MEPWAQATVAKDLLKFSQPADYELNLLITKGLKSDGYHLKRWFTHNRSVWLSQFKHITQNDKHF